MHSTDLSETVITSSAIYSEKHLKEWEGRTSHTAKLYVLYAAEKEKLNPPKDNYLPLHGVHRDPGKSIS